MADPTPREPWLGYAQLSDDERRTTFEQKRKQAEDRRDQAYAVALASAVANYEKLQDLSEHAEMDASMHDAATSLHDDAGSWRVN